MNAAKLMRLNGDLEAAIELLEETLEYLPAAYGENSAYAAQCTERIASMRATLAQ